MANIIFKVLFFMIVFNFAIGLNIEFVPAFKSSIYNSTMTGGLEYNPLYANEFNSTMSKAITPAGVIENAQFAISRVLDTIGLGFVAKFLGAISNYLYGFANLIDILFGAMLGDSRRFVLDILKIMTSIGYGYCAYQLWKGKDLDSD